MAGIVFFKTTNLEEVTNFYLNKLDMKIWLRQPVCNILQSDQLIVGFLQSEKSETEGTMTLFFKTREEVDHYYEKLKNIAVGKPKVNEKYNIYHFYARDPEKRLFEIQCFLHDLLPWQSGKQLLKERRSIRSFQKRIVEKEILEEVFELCRFAPTSRNSQSFYFVVIENSSTLNWLSTLRENASAPINKAPLAIAVCADHTKTIRKEQDACIAATYLLLAAHLYGLGTCWITAMDREDIKERLEIPQEDYIACITPIGYPHENPNLPGRRRVEEFVIWK